MSSPTSLPDGGPTLFLDAASPRLYAGLRTTGGAPAWRETEDEAGVGLFRCTDELLRTAGLVIGDLRSVVFCDGPGSLLGIRLVAIAIRTWMTLARAGLTSSSTTTPDSQPLRVFAYHSLALVAADLLAGGEQPPFHVCSDARRETWNLLSIAAGAEIGDVRRCTPAELPRDAGPLFTPETFPHWQPLPVGARGAPYRPQRVPELIRQFPSLLHETAAPDAFLTEMPTYRVWTAR